MSATIQRISPRRRRAAQWLGLLFFLAPSVGVLAISSAAAPDEELRLKLKSAVFDPASGLPADIVEKEAPVMSLSAPRGRGELYIVQFRAMPGPEEQARLAGLGMKVLDSVPERALIVRLDEGTSAGSLRSIAGVRAVVPLAPKLRLSPELRGLGSLKPQSAGGEEVRITAFLFIDGDADALVDTAKQRFPEVSVTLIHREPPLSLQFSGPPARLEALAVALAHHPDVLFVDRSGPGRVVNDNSVWIGQSYDRNSGPGEATAADPKPYTFSGTVFNHGITGTGQIIGIADTRLQYDSCYFNDSDPNHPLIKQQVAPPGLLNLNLDANHRKILAYNKVGPLAIADAPPYGAFWHGTHTTGSAVGDGVANLSTPTNAGHNAADGMAPNAKVVYLDITSSIDPNCVDQIGYFQTDYVLRQEYDAGARISTNSYGTYSQDINYVDTAIYERPDLLVFFSAGNIGEGNCGGTIDGAALAKNTIAVGATESYDAFANPPKDPENLWGGTCPGPTTGGRIKPDISAPGVAVSSAQIAKTYYPDVNCAAGQHDPLCASSSDVCYMSINTCANDPNNNTHGCYVNNLAQTCSTLKMTGTSMASPTAAGLGALARQYFTSGFYPTGQASVADQRNPSAALLKAVLINGARNMTGKLMSGGTPPNLQDAPSNLQGWGRVMLDDALYFAGDSRKLFITDVATATGLTTGQSLFYQLNVTSNGAPLKITLAWTDPPNTPGTSPSLINNLDLVVTGPDRVTVYKGNKWTADDINVAGDKESAANPVGSDTVNNVEGILIKSPSLGKYRIEVRGTSVPGRTGYPPPQGFGLAATGQFTGAASGGPTPTLSSISPNFGLNNDPTPVVITGTLFQATPQVYLGSAAYPLGYSLTGVTFNSSTQLQATVPVNMANGTYMVTVVNPDGGLVSLNNAFTVGAPVQGPNPVMYIPVPSQDVNAADQVALIDLSLGTALTPINLSSQADPVDIAINRNSGMGLIAMWGYNQPGRVGIITLNPGTVATTIDVPGAAQGRTPRAVAMSTDGKTGYYLTALQGYPSSQELTRLNLGNPTDTTTRTIGNMGDVDSADLQISPDGARLYATNVGDDTVSVIRTSDFSEITRVAVGNGPVGIGVSPDSTRVFVTNYFASTISVIDATLATPVTINTFNVAYQGNGTQPTHVVVSPDGAKLYVTFDAFLTVSAVDAATGSITQSLGQGGQFRKAAYVPSLSKLFALDFSNHALKRLNPTNLSVDWTQTLASYAYGMDWVEPVPLTITSVAPTVACKTGGTTVTITGSAFQGQVWDGYSIVQQPTRVFIGGVEVNYVNLIDSTHVSVVAPAHAQGFVNVEVRNPNGQSATLTNGLRYMFCQQ